jgi:hypothetical protein
MTVRLDEKEEKTVSYIKESAIGKRGQQKRCRD